MTLKEFADKVKAASENVATKTSTLVKATASVVGETLIELTPVDTGRARTNWRASLDTPFEQLLYPSPQRPPSPEVAKQEALTDLKRTIDQYKDYNWSIHLTNNVPYIVLLNSGSSAQAPAGFIEASVLAAKALIRLSEFRIFEPPIVVRWTRK
jgi:hypothetical protein